MVSLYVPDANSVEAAKWMQQMPLPVLITALGELELVNAVQLRLFRKEVRSSEARAARAALRADLRDGVFAIQALSEEMFAHARRLASRWTARLGTRSLDIIHVAAAIALGCRYVSYRSRTGSASSPPRLDSRSPSGISLAIQFHCVEECASPPFGILFVDRTSQSCVRFAEAVYELIGYRYADRI